MHIRLYTPRDREAVRRIACDKADHGEPGERLFADREVVADLLTRYYTDHEAAAVWVAEHEGQVVGYLTGCVDSQRYWRMMVWRIGPMAVWRAIGDGALWSRQTWCLFGALLRTWLRGGLNRQVSFERYPAHLHLNIQQEFRGQHVGQRLVEQFLQQARAEGLTGIHIPLRADNGPARGLFERLGFTILSRQTMIRPTDPIDGIVDTVIYGKTF